VPLTPKGRKIESAMEKTYGAKKGRQVLYASKNAGKIGGIDAAPAGPTDVLKRAIKAGTAESEAQKQALKLLQGKSVSGRDRAKAK
jgi:hypothetical protein